ERVLVLPPARVAGRLERAVGAVGEARQERAGVVDLDLPALAGLVLDRPLLDEDLGHAGYRADRAVEPERRVDVVARQVARDSGARDRLVQPPQGPAAERHVRRDGPVLQVGRAVVEDLPEPPL